MHKNKFITIALLLFLFISCKKEKDEPGTASLTIVNAVAGSKIMVPNFKADGPGRYKTAPQLYYGYFDATFYSFRSYSGMQRVRLYEYPDTLEKARPLFDLNIDLPISSITTLFLTGTTTAPESISLRDTIPYIPAGDSTMAIRFINLSPGSNPISVNLQNESNGSELSTLAYKSISGFKNYPVKKNRISYFFEFRDVATGNLLATYSIPDLFPFSVNPWLYRSMTLVFQGMPGGTGSLAQSALVVPHFRIN